MKKLAYLVIAAILPALAFSQNQSEVPKIKARTDLVLVPVVVQKGGAHLSGLQKSEFTLLQDGQQQTIDVFEEVHAAIPNKNVELAPNEFSNQRAAVDSPQRLTVIALDLVNTAPTDQAYLKQELMKFLNTAAKTEEPYALLAITGRGVTVLQDFTTDIKAIGVAVENTKTAPIGRARPGSLDNTYLDQTPCAASATGCGGNKTFGQAGLQDLGNWEDLYRFAEGHEIFLDRTSRLSTLGSLVQIAQYLNGFPGRKILIWAGSGIPWAGGMNRVMYGGNGAATREGGTLGSSNARPTQLMTFNPELANSSMEENMSTLKILNSANISVYPVDARHGANTSFNAFDTSRADATAGVGGFAGEKGRIQNDDQERITTFQQMAAHTGGKPCFNRTDLANCFTEFASDSHDYYMLGYYPDKKTKPGWHPLTLKLSQKAELRYRKGYVYSNTPPDKDGKADFQLAMLSPLPFTALIFNGQISANPSGGGKKTVRFDIALPTGVIDLGEHGDALNFDVVAVARNTEGKEVAKFAQRINRTLQPAQAEVVRGQGIQYNGKIELPSGKYGLWIVVRDNSTGKIGSAITTLTLE